MKEIIITKGQLIFWIIAIIIYIGCAYSIGYSRGKNIMFKWAKEVFEEQNKDLQELIEKLENIKEKMNPTND